MIRCDYCGREVKARQPYIVLDSLDLLRHYHADPDRQEGDCAGRLSLALSNLTGTRPDPPTTS